MAIRSSAPLPRAWGGEGLWGWRILRNFSGTGCSSWRCKHLFLLALRSSPDSPAFPAAEDRQVGKRAGHGLAVCFACGVDGGLLVSFPQEVQRVFAPLLGEGSTAAVGALPQGFSLRGYYMFCLPENRGGAATIKYRAGNNERDILGEWAARSQTSGLHGVRFWSECGNSAKKASKVWKALLAL